MARHPAEPCRPVPASALADRPALALAALLPILGCGEEAAGVAFDGLAQRLDDDPGVARTLRRIADEERVHDALIHQLLNGLPAVARDRTIIAAARRFHVSLVRGGPMLHLARIAALDSAVCTVLGRLLRRGSVLARDHDVRTVLHRIHRDEARHVRISRTLVLDHAAARATQDAAAAARHALADLLALAGDAFEALGVDAALLDRDLRRLPDGLLRA